MVKQEDILKMLQEGADADAIAQQFTDALNGAIAEKKAADEKNKMRTAHKLAKMQAIIDEVFEFIDTYYPDFKVPQEMRDEVTAETIIDAMDQAEKEIKQLMSFAKTLKNDETFQKVVKERGAGNQVKRPVSGDPIAAFLKANGLA